MIDYIPQIIYIVLMGISLGVALIKHGEPREHNYHFGLSLLGALISVGLLYWGGFFS